MTNIMIEKLRLEIPVLLPEVTDAADAFTLKDTTAINQAPVTGESMPVDKRPVQDDAASRANPDAASRVFAGTINGSGLVEIEVTRLSTESTLAKVVKLVSEAETQKSPTQRFTDSFKKFFVPPVPARRLIIPRNAALCEARSGARGRNRTADTMIFSHVLYQLSYPGLRLRRSLYRGFGDRRAVGCGPMAKRAALGNPPLGFFEAASAQPGSFSSGTCAGPGMA